MSKKKPENENEQVIRKKQRNSSEILKERRKKSLRDKRKTRTNKW